VHHGLILSRAGIDCSFGPSGMATYIYETIPPTPGQKPERFEVVQGMAEAPLTRHPASGQPVRRVITGGFGFIAAGSKAESGPAVAPCAAGCACHRGSYVPAS
jgi:predicted nucleic acid-binding Zn ribbon protein